MRADAVILRFNTGEGAQENAIVTSTGEFVVAWDFAKVKKGLLDKYEIKKYEDHVVQDNFKFGDDKEIVSFSSLYVVCTQLMKFELFRLSRWRIMSLLSTRRPCADLPVPRSPRLARTCGVVRAS